VKKIIRELTSTAGSMLLDLLSFLSDCQRLNGKASGILGIILVSVCIVTGEIVKASFLPSPMRKK